MTKLSFNEDYQTFSGLISTPATIVSEPRDVTDIIGATTTTFSFDVQLENNVEFTFTHQDESITGMIAAGTVTVTARGGQYNPEVHHIHGQTLLNINIVEQDGEFKTLLSAAPLMPGASVKKPSITFTRVNAMVPQFDDVPEVETV